MCFRRHREEIDSVLLEAATEVLSFRVRRRVSDFVGSERRSRYVRDRL
jgi:hypothetical protein